jgi:hypothetical protein
MKKSDIVKAYLSLYPTMKGLTLATKIYQENKEYFSHVENARKQINYYRGLSGEIDRRKLKIRTFQVAPTYDTTKTKMEKINTTAKVLILDIETAPISAYVWGIWQQNVGTHQIQSD